MIKKFLLMMMTAVFVLCTGCGGNPAAKSEPPKQNLAVGVLPDTDSLPFWVAAEKGYFAEEGLAVDLKSFKSAMDRDAALQSGNLDGAVSDMLAAAFAREGGFDVKITSSTDGNYVLVSAPHEPAKTPGELRDKEVAVSKNTIIEYVTDRILMQENLPTDSIKKVVIPQIPTRLEMLQNDKLAAATLPNPMSTVALAAGCHKIADAESMHINPGVMVFTGKAVNEKKAEIQAMYRAYNKAVKYLATAAREEYIKLAIDKGGFPPAVEKSLELPAYRQATMPTAEDLTACLAWLHDKNLVKGDYTYEELTVNILPSAAP